jgi:hypothetical protein
LHFKGSDVYFIAENWDRMQVVSHSLMAYFPRVLCRKALSVRPPRRTALVDEASDSDSLSASDEDDAKSVLLSGVEDDGSEDERPTCDFSKILITKLGLGKSADGARNRPTFLGKHDADIKALNSSITRIYKLLRPYLVYAIHRCLVLVLHTEAESIHEMARTQHFIDDDVDAQMALMASNSFARNVDKARTIERAFAAALTQMRREHLNLHKEWSEPEKHDFDELLLSLVCKEDLKYSPLQHLRSLVIMKNAIPRLFDATLRFDDVRLCGEDYNVAATSYSQKYIRGMKGIVRYGLNNRRMHWCF